MNTFRLKSCSSNARGTRAHDPSPDTDNPCHSAGRVRAVSGACCVQTIFIVFGGVYVTADNVPSYLKWLPRTSLIKYAYEGLCVNEFRGMEFETSGASGDLATGDQASGSAFILR